MSKPDNIDEEAWLLMCGYFATVFGWDYDKMCNGFLDLLASMGYEITKSGRPYDANNP